MSLPKPPGHFDRPTDPYPRPKSPNFVYIQDPDKNIPNSGPHARKDKKRSRNCFCSVCIWITTFILTKILFLAILIGLAYFFLHPTLPEFHVQQLSVSQIKLSDSSDQATLGSQVNAVVKLANNNTDLSFKYKPINFEIWASGIQTNDILSGKGVSLGFLQGGKNVTLVKRTVDMKSAKMDQNTAEQIISNAKKGSLVVNIQVSTGVKVLYKDWKWSFVHIPVHLLCKGVGIGATKAGNKPSCQFNLVNSFLREIDFLKN